MKKVLFSVKPHKLKILDQMDNLRGNTPRSAFILQSIEYMIDTHKKNKGMLSPLDHSHNSRHLGDLEIIF